LGVDPKKYKYHSGKKENEYNNDDDSSLIQNAFLQTETSKSLSDRAIATLKVICPNCSTQYDFPGVYSNNNISGMICVNCKEILPEKYVKNRITLFLKQLLVLYYEGGYNCVEPGCKHQTR
jgi:Zn ribbon nucleic-acid-binding protein